VGRQLLAAQKVNFVWARLFYLFGEEEAQNRLVPDVIQKLLRGLPVSLTEGQQQRDFMYIGDAVRAVADIYESQVCGAVNVASGEPITVRRLVEIIASELGNYHLLKFGDRPENACDPVCIVADTSRLNNEVGFEREFSIDVAVRSVVDWWRRQDSVIQ
jgi:nucleoside-diphosphate-sugar epimerase